MDLASISHSQNFLKSPVLVSELIGKSSIYREDLVLEIGTGKGVITDELVKKAGNVIAYEIDGNLYQLLRDKLSHCKNLDLRQENFLKANLPVVAYKVFSNIPFNQTADIIKKLITSDNPPADTYLIVQKESAYKFVGSPEAKESLASLLLKAEFEPNIIHNFRRTDFEPIPHVDSVLMRIKLRESPLVRHTEEPIYRDFISYAMSQWKPNLKEGLKKVFTPAQFSHSAHDLNFSQSAKPTQLSFGQYLGLFRYFLTGVDNSKKTIVLGYYKKLLQNQTSLTKIHRTRLDENWRLFGQSS